MTQEFFDPAWVRSGEFDLSSDRRPTRTVRVRKALEELEGRSFSLVKLDRRGRTSTYYLREGKRPFVEAQYYMTLDRACHTLSLGVSIEKGHTHAGAERDRRMDKTWDWPHFMALGASRLTEALSAITAALGRSVAVVAESHVPDADEPTGERRDTVPFVFDGVRWTMRAAQVTPAAPMQYLSELNRRPALWADVWIVADFTEQEIGALTPSAVARALFAFRSLRHAIRQYDSAPA